VRHPRGAYLMRGDIEVDAVTFLALETMVLCTFGPRAKVLRPLEPKRSDGRARSYFKLPSWAVHTLRVALVGDSELDRSWPERAGSALTEELTSLVGEEWESVAQVTVDIALAESGCLIEELLAPKLFSFRACKGLRLSIDESIVAAEQLAVGFPDASVLALC
jgi:hypothetical protein